MGEPQLQKVEPEEPDPSEKERDRTCTRYVHFPVVRDLEDLGISIDKDYYDIAADSVRERGLHIKELSGHCSDYFMFSGEGVDVRIKEEFYATSSRDRSVILVYGSYENRERFAVLEGLKK